MDELDPAVSFWRAFTGWVVAEDVPGVYAELRTPSGLRFGLYARQHYVTNLGPEESDLVKEGLQRTEIYVRVDDARGSLSRATALGPPCLRASPPSHGGMTSGISEPLVASSWPLRSPSIAHESWPHVVVAPDRQGEAGPRAYR
ncbi:VOC family protein [Oerskovia paurometabola]|uniref:VOC family protein n=1 Tax=Oerskovia paurometabola TaxID=162170 RepID=UPI003820C12E